ncbi:MAG: hypothetical protein ABL958_10355 [Bdellovibrionia bacterium]
MKKFLIAVFVLSAGIGAAALSYENDSCSQPGRFAPLCRTMKHLKSHILLLDSQRDLNQANFGFLAVTLESFRQSIVSLSAVGSWSIHLEKLEAAKVLTEKALVEARNLDPQVFKTANQIKTSCQQCHNSSSPAGLKWDDIFKTSWSVGSSRCDEPGRNPFVCRQMHALVSIFESFESGANAGRLDFNFAAANAREARRIVHLLQSFRKPIHEGGNALLKDIELKAIELEDLAMRQSPLVFEKAPAVSWSCIQCHSVR